MKIVTMMFALMLSAPTFASVYLNPCFEYQQQGVSYTYQSCVNRNFSRISNELGIFLSHCSNYGDEVSYSFTSCVERNFNSIESKVTSLYLGYCSNFDRERLSYSFTSCVNRNFDSVEREINK